MQDEALSGLVDDGETELEGGDYAAARGRFEAAIAEAERAHGALAKELIVPLMGLARAAGGDHGTRGPELERELEVQRRALAIAERALPADDPLLAEVLHAHAVSVWASGEPAPAATLLLRALAIVRGSGGDAHGYLGPLVGALLDAKRPAEALPHARDLLALEDRSGPADLTTLFVIGQCFRDAGATLDARPVLVRFLAALGDGGEPLIRDEVRAWLAGTEAPPA